jgi:hypothetical protein
MEKPPFEGMVHVDVLARESGIPKAGARGTMFLIHQKVNPDTCTYSVLANQKLSFTTGSNGHFVYDGVTFTHDNSEDLYRIEITMEVPFNPYSSNRKLREIKVAKYSDSNFQFTFDIPPPLN